MLVEPLRIAICEDDQSDIDCLLQIIASSGVPAKVSSYADGNGLLATFKPGFFQLIFLDIYFDNGGGTALRKENESQAGSVAVTRKRALATLPGNATGMDVALKIRETDAAVWLAFLTVSPDHALQGYRVEAKRYFNKPPDAAEVVPLLQKAAAFFCGRPDEINLVINHKRRCLRVREIQYIEAQNKKCLLHLGAETLAANTTLAEFSRLLTAPAFIRCHRSYIVNLNYVQSLDRDFTMLNGDKVYVGHLRQWQVRSDYRKHLLRLAKEV